MRQLDPTIHFKVGPHGLAAPVGTSIGDWIYPSGDLSARQQLRQSLLEAGIGTVADFKDLWPDERMTPAAAFSALPAQWWLNILSRFALCACSPNVDTDEFTRMLVQMLSSSARLNFQRKYGHKPNPRLLCPFSVLLAIELASFMGADHEPPSEGARDTLVRPILLLSQTLNSSVAGNIKSSPSGIAATLTERSRLGDPRHWLLRAYNVWVHDHADLSSESREFRAAADRTMRERIGIDLASMIGAIGQVLTFYLSLDLKTLSNGAVCLDLQRLPLTEAGNHAIDITFAQLTATVQDFASACRSRHQTRSLLENPTLESLRQYPCVYVESSTRRMSLLSPVHLAASALDRPLRIMSDAGVENPRTAFGQLAEDHVHHALSSMFHKRYQRLDSHDKHKQADGILWYEDGFIVVEVKARGVPDKRRFKQRNDTEYTKELTDRDIDKAVAQVESTINRVMRGRIQCQCCLPVRVAASLIVTTEESPTSFIAASVLNKLLPDTRHEYGIAVLRPQLLSLSDLEALDMWSGKRLIDVLNVKMRDRDRSLEALHIHMHSIGERPAMTTYAQDVLSKSRSTFTHWLRRQ